MSYELNSAGSRCKISHQQALNYCRIISKSGNYVLDAIKHIRHKTFINKVLWRIENYIPISGTRLHDSLCPFAGDILLRRHSKLFLETLGKVTGR